MPRFQDPAPELADFRERYGTEEKCRRHVYATLYPDGYPCLCGCRARLVRGSPTIECRTCGRRYPLLRGTIFHRTQKPLRMWFKAAFWLRDPRMSARELARRLKLSYDTAWRWMAKLRKVITNDPLLQTIRGATVHRPESCPPPCPICPGLKKVDWTSRALPDVADLRWQVFIGTCGKASDYHIDSYLAVAAMRRDLGRMPFFLRLVARMPLHPPIEYAELIMPREPRRPLRFRVRRARRAR